MEIDYDHLTAAFGVDGIASHGVGADLPVTVTSTGFPFLVIPVNFLEHLSTAGPSDAAIAGLATEHDAAGFYVYTFDAIDDNSTLHARCLAPNIDISEDLTTGTAAGTCGIYLQRVGALDPIPDGLRLEQGRFVDRPGTVRMQVSARMRVGDRAVQSFDNEIIVPEFTDDDIIETWTSGLKTKRSATTEAASADVPGVVITGDAPLLLLLRLLNPCSDFLHPLCAPFGQLGVDTELKEVL